METFFFNYFSAWVEEVSMEAQNTVYIKKFSTSSSARMNFPILQNHHQGNQHEHWSQDDFLEIRKEKKSFFLRRRKGDNVNIKSIAKRDTWICFSFIHRDAKEKCIQLNLNRKLWLHKFPLVSLAYSAINYVFTPSTTFLEVSRYKMNNDCVCTALFSPQFLFCCYQHYAHNNALAKSFQL